MDGVTIAVDAMGGDHAPDAVTRGVAAFLRRNTAARVILSGKERVLRRELRRHELTEETRVDVVNAREAIFMRENLLSYWKKREQSSLKKALDLLRDGRAQAMYSAGNTGAIMALAKTTLGTLGGVERPVLALMIPTLKGQTLLMDVGANVDPTPRQLAESAIMGKVLLERVYGVANPRIALMSIGEEEGKGNELTKHAFALLSSLDINFTGNIEGRDAYLGEVDLIVTDGFTGNVTLKVAEGVVDLMMRLMKREIRGSWSGRLGFFLIRRTLKRIHRRLDHQERGGALLLGVRGLVVIGHGSASDRSVKNGLELCQRFIREDVVARMAEEMERMRERILVKEYRHV